MHCAERETMSGVLGAIGTGLTRVLLLFCGDWSGFDVMEELFRMTMNRERLKDLTARKATSLTDRT